MTNAAADEAQKHTKLMKDEAWTEKRERGRGGIRTGWAASINGNPVLQKDDVEKVKNREGGIREDMEREREESKRGREKKQREKR